MERDRGNFMRDAFYMIGDLLMNESDLTVFENKQGLAGDMKFLASKPEFCDATFLVGPTREPVCGVRAILATRSQVFLNMLYPPKPPQAANSQVLRVANQIKIFFKRGSEPLLGQWMSDQTPKLPPQEHITIIIDEFEPDVFRHLIEYAHTGVIYLQPRTLLGVLSASEFYAMEELGKVCMDFLEICINIDTVCPLLAGAEKYINYKCTKPFVEKVLKFVEKNGTDVLNLGSFTRLPQHIVRLIFTRERLKVDEFTKFSAALLWCKKFCDNNDEIVLKDIMYTFIEYIQFHKIPAVILMKDIYPIEIVPYEYIMNALAYQADSTSVEPINLSQSEKKNAGKRKSKSALEFTDTLTGSNNNPPMAAVEEVPTSWSAAEPRSRSGTGGSLRSRPSALFEKIQLKTIITKSSPTP